MTARRIGPYELLDEIGRGGMGAVYRAWDPAAQREVALKVALSGQLTQVQLERFRREGELAGRLQHPGIVAVHAAGEHQGQPYLACELVPDCQELQQAFARRDLPGRVELVRDAALALGYAHEQGLVHRDVKPSNVLVDGSGQVKVADFGLVAGRDLDRLTRTGVFVGTVTHMAPEQLRGKEGGEPAPTMDVWSLGVLLYEALTGTLPFEAEHLGGLVSKVAEADPEPPRLRSADVPVELERVCLRALGKDPHRRQPNGTALGLELAALLEQRASWSTSHLGVVLLRARRRAPIILAACVVVGAILAAVFYPVPDTSPEPSVPKGRPAAVEIEAPSDVAVEEAGRAFDAIKRLPAREKTRAAERWLAANAEHPLAPRAKRILQKSPLQTWEGEFFVCGRFLGEEHVVLRDRQGVLLWSLESDSVEWRGKGAGSEPLVRVTRAGDRFAYNAEKAVKIVAFPKLTVSELRLPGLVYALAFSPDGDSLAVGGEFEGIWLFDLRGASAPVVIGRRGDIRCLAWSNDGEHLASGVGKARKRLVYVDLWSVATRAQLGEADIMEKVNVVLFSSDDASVLATDNQGSIWRFDAPRLTPNGELLADDQDAGDYLSKRRAHAGRVSDMAIDPVTQRILSVSASGSRVNDLCAWDQPSFHRVGLWLESDVPYHAVDLSPSGGRVLLVSMAETLRFPSVARVWQRSLLE